MQNPPNAPQNANGLQIQAGWASAKILRRKPLAQAEEVAVWRQPPERGSLPGQPGRGDGRVGKVLTQGFCHWGVFLMAESLWTPPPPSTKPAWMPEDQPGPVVTSHFGAMGPGQQIVAKRGQQSAKVTKNTQKHQKAVKSGQWWLNQSKSQQSDQKQSKAVLKKGPKVGKGSQRRSKAAKKGPKVIRNGHRAVTKQQKVATNASG